MRLENLRAVRRFTGVGAQIKQGPAGLQLGLLVPVGSLSVTEARIDQLVNGRARPVIIRPASIALSLGALAAACVLVAVQGTRVPAEHLPIVLSVPGSVVAAAALLFVAAISGGVEQVRLVARR